MASMTNKSTLLVALICIALALELTCNVDGQKIDCAGKCDYRCSKSSRPNLCKRACNTCCERCNCVPPGTAGNTDVCPCYANMTTHDGKLKCP